jgi:hypothetical protein
MDAEAYAFVEKEFVGRLDHNTGAISGIVLTTAGPAVFHVLEDRQGIRDDLMGFVALDVGNEPDTTRIAFKLRGVKSVFDHVLLARLDVIQFFTRNISFLMALAVIKRLKIQKKCGFQGYWLKIVCPQGW